MVTWISSTCKMSFPSEREVLEMCCVMICCLLALRFIRSVFYVTSLSLLKERGRTVEEGAVVIVIRVILDIVEILKGV